PLEEPTDRTVDDHIYRLRKKLIGWSHLFTLESIRGYGYKLVEKGSPAAKTPLALPEVVQNVQRLIETYHGLGMGDAMQTLSSNR
ncbi:helix-turn-helix domain-containing protein, partial [Frankia sp. Cpl3]|nr:helix-turn-helix domain-containing protein [Frankia sp. Cpl3]